jgi:mono/diheme cytochrome c family protein
MPLMLPVCQDRCWLVFRLLFVSVFVLAVMPVRAQGDSEVAHGKALVEVNCASCHGVGSTDKSSHSDAPLFRILSKRYPLDALEEAFAEGISTGHPDMPEFMATRSRLAPLSRISGASMCHEC